MSRKLDDRLPIREQDPVREHDDAVGASRLDPGEGRVQVVWAFHLDGLERQPQGLRRRLRALPPAIAVYGLDGLRSTATRESFGSVSLMSSSHFPPNPP